MRKPRGLPKKVRVAAAEPLGLSPLYRYMKANHAQLAATAGADGRMNWVVLCAEFARKGITGGEGKAPSPLRATRTWAKVRADLERLAAAKAARPPAKRPPSRLPDSLRPLEAPRPGGADDPGHQPPPGRPQPVPAFPWTSGPAAAPPLVPVARSPPIADAGSQPTDPADRKAIARAKLARLDAQFAHEDRFLHPPKKRDTP